MRYTVFKKKKEEKSHTKNLENYKLWRKKEKKKLKRKTYISSNVFPSQDNLLNRIEGQDQDLARAGEEEVGEERN